MYAVAYAPAHRPAPPRRRNRGLGTQQSAGTAVAIGSSVAATGVALASIGGASSVLAGIVGAAAVPFIGPALAAATLIVSALVKNSGCGQTCIETSQWANQAAMALRVCREKLVVRAGPEHMDKKVSQAKLDLPVKWVPQDVMV